MELKESLGLRTASRTELLKSEKTSTAEVKSWLVLVELSWSSVWMMTVESGEVVSTLGWAEQEGRRWSGRVWARLRQHFSSSSLPVWVRICRQVFVSRMIFSTARLSSGLNCCLAWLRLRHSCREKRMLVAVRRLALL